MIRWHTLANTLAFRILNLSCIDFFNKLNQTFNAYQPIMAIMFRAKFAESPIFYEKFAPNDTNIEQFVKLEPYPQWFKKAIEAYYFQTFPFEFTTDIGQRELEIFLIRFDWHRPIPEFTNILRHSVFAKDCTQLWTLIHNLIFPVPTNIQLLRTDLVRTTGMRFCIFDAESHPILWNALAQTDSRKIYFIYKSLNIPIRILSTIEKMFTKPRERMLFTCLIYMELTACIPGPFLNALLISLFVPDLALQSGEAEFIQNWHVSFKSYMNTANNNECLNHYNLFQLFISSFNCLTRILRMPAYNISYFIPRLNGLYINDIFCGGRKLETRTMINNLFTKFPVLIEYYHFIKDQSHPR